MRPLLLAVASLGLFLPMKSMAARSLDTWASLLETGSELECADSYEARWYKCMLRQKANRQMRLFINTTAAPTALNENVCKSVVEELTAKSNLQLASLGVEPGAIEFSQVAHTFHGGTNTATRFECEVTAVSTRKDIRFKPRYMWQGLNESQAENETLCDKSVTQFQAGNPKMLGTQGKVLRGVTDALQTACYMTGFEIGKDEVLPDGKIRKFGSGN